MPAYASFIQFPTEKAYVQLALECKESGYKAIKIHPYWGGITGVMKAAHLAEAFSMKFEPASWGSALNQAAGLHAMLAMVNCEFFKLPTRRSYP